MSDPQSQKIAAAREATSPINVTTLSMDLFPLRLQPELDQAAVMSVVHRPTLQRIPTVPSGGTHSHIGKRLLVGSIVRTFSNQRIDRATNLKAAAREI